MRRQQSIVSLLICLFVGTAATAAAQDALIDLGSKGARKTRAERGASLAPPGTTRVDAVRAFLRARHDETTLSELVQTKDHEFGGVGHAGFGQRVAGLDVYGTYVKASFSATGDLVSVVENLVSTSRALRPSQVGPDAALRAVLARYYPGAAAGQREAETVGNVTRFERRDPFSEAPTVTRVALPTRGAVLDSGYLVVTWDRANMLRHTVVSGLGQIVYEELRTNSDRYNIFPNKPTAAAGWGQTEVSFPANPAASPSGWVTSNTTIGNNVDAYLDRDANNVADTGSRPVSATQQFLDVWNGTIAPTDPTNQKVAVTNLFYLNNIVHDRLYLYGFTESAGNFQTNNFGLGGLGNDPVNAEAQDGAGTNNANFGTPGDGSRPRMQMFLWTAPTPDRDGDLDSDIVYHEYGHGLTWRMIGNMSGVFAGAIGEGMSDTVALYINGDDKVGEYSTNSVNGIRSAPYSGYTRTYGDYSGTGVHYNGEIYAATMWRLRQLWTAKGWSTDTLFRYVVDGMNYTASRPAFEDMRDGILESTANLDTELDSAEAECTVWDAFAQFGVGVGANGVEQPFSITESFTKPATCGGTPPPGGFVLTAEGFKQKGVRNATLTWTGTSGTVAIYRNNVNVATDSASPYTDTIPGKGAGTFIYRVCSVATSVCSNNATVTF
jgi:hypothetical protein